MLNTADGRGNRAYEESIAVLFGKLGSEDVDEVHFCQGERWDERRKVREREPD
jgi:hypothetical protein